MIHKHEVLTIDQIVSEINTKQNRIYNGTQKWYAFLPMAKNKQKKNLPISIQSSSSSLVIKQLFSKKNNQISKTAIIGSSWPSYHTGFGAIMHKMTHKYIKFIFTIY